ncbi:MAG TPA: hypothetical protein VMD79_10270 [Solirubrobacteraceae bacterium]|nr:hypothetical protein [Solirubrobacteraceae bacterium]
MGKLRSWKRGKLERERREAAAKRAITYVARDGRGRVIASR